MPETMSAEATARFLLNTADSMGDNPPVYIEVLVGRKLVKVPIVDVAARPDGTIAIVTQ